MKIGIVGQGFVGTAVREGLKNHHTINTFDLVKESTCDSISDLVNKSKYIFVCVPTPMKEDGSCDTSIVEDVVKDVNSLTMTDKIVIIKSCLTQSFSQRLIL